MRRKICVLNNLREIFKTQFSMLIFLHGDGKMYRVIASTAWLGGKPWEDDRFEENADRLNLDIFVDDNISKLPGEYVILDQDTLFYHATGPENVDSILDSGLR